MTELTYKLRKKVYDIIELLIDPVEQNKLVESLPYLHTNTWDELVEERHVGKLCGYPTCSRQCRPNFQRQMFQIDRKSGKIYENCKERNKFCSDYCFDRSLKVREQLDDEALWLTGETQARMSKKFTIPDEKPVLIEEIDEDEVKFTKPTKSPMKTGEKSVQLIEDSILAQMNDLKIKDEQSDVESDPEEDEFKHIQPYSKTKEDEEFLNDVKNFISSRSASCSSISKDKSPSSKSATAAKRKEDDVLKRLREKYGKGQNKLKKPPVIIDPLPLKTPSASTTVKEEHKFSWLLSLLESWITDETHKFIKEGYRPKGGEVEKILMDFLSGKPTKDEFVNLPNLDKFNIKEKRLNILLQAIKQSWNEFEEKLHLQSTRRSYLPQLLSTFNLTSENITGWNKREIKCIVVALFLILFQADSELCDEFYQKKIFSPVFVENCQNLCSMTMNDLNDILSLIHKETKC